MTNVLFTHSYLYKLDRKQWKFKQPYPPLGTIQAAAVIREAGFNVSLYDVNMLDDIEGIGTVLQQRRPAYVVIYDDGFNYLTKMCLTVMREAAFGLAKRAKKVGCTVIVCSSDAADHYEKYFLNGADYVIRGEGEQALKELLLALEKRADVTTIGGLVVLKSGKPFLTPPRAVMRNLDELPLPAWDLINIDDYRKIWKRKHGYFSLNIATTRGCPYKCNWCAKPIYGNRYNSRSPEHVVKEIAMLVEKYKPDHFWMCDDIFGLKPGWVQQFRDLVVEKQLKFRFKIQSRADLVCDEETVVALATAGCETVWLGAESGSQRILDAMEKGISIQQIREATHLLRKNNIKVGFFLQFGYLGETREDIQSTIGLVLELMPDEVGISIAYPLPGTKFYDNVKAQLRDKQNWKDSDDLDMMFQNQFGSGYYRQLHRYVHSLYRKEKGYHNLKKLLSSPFSISPKEIRSGLATFYYIPTTIARRVRLKKLEASKVQL